MVCRTFDGGENPISVFRHPTREPVKDINVRNLFRVHAYSQGEGISIARNPLAQLDLIDNHLKLSSYKREIENAYTTLKGQKGIAVLQAKVDNKETVERDKATNEINLTALRKQLESSEEAKKNSIVTSHQKWNEEKNISNS